jgi:hypothetical protein
MDTLDPTGAGTTRTYGNRERRGRGCKKPTVSATLQWLVRLVKLQIISFRYIRKFEIISSLKGSAASAAAHSLRYRCSTASRPRLFSACATKDVFFAGSERLSLFPYPACVNAYRH